MYSRMLIVENTSEFGHYVSVTLLCRLTSTCQWSITMQCLTVSTDAPTSSSKRPFGGAVHKSMRIPRHLQVARWN